MSDIVVCTICSEKKHAGQALMPAIQRYDSDRISKVFAESQRRALLFRILSGRFGLLRPERPIPCYGLLLEADRVGEMAGLAARQLQEEAVSIVVFYARRTADWEPYRQVLEKACERAKVQLLEVEWRS